MVLDMKMMLMMLFLTLRPESLSKKGDDDYDYDASRMLELDDNKDQMLEEDNTRMWSDASSSTMFMAIQGDDGDNDDGAGRNPGPG